MMLVKTFTLTEGRNEIQTRQEATVLMTHNSTLWMAEPQDIEYECEERVFMVERMFNTSILPEIGHLLHVGEFYNEYEEQWYLVLEVLDH